MGISSLARYRMCTSLCWRISLILTSKKAQQSGNRNRDSDDPVINETRDEDEESEMVTEETRHHID